MQIIIANESHFEILLELFKELDDYHYPLAPDRIRKYSERSRSEEQLRAYIEGEDRILFLAKMENEYVGFINIRTEFINGNHLQRKRKLCLLDNAYVKEPYRKQGVSSKLLDSVRTWCRERNISKIELQVFSSNSTAVAFYTAMGFEVFTYRMELNVDIK